MVKSSTVITMVIFLFTESIQALAQEDPQLDKHATELLIATQSITYFADSLNLISRPGQLPRFLADSLLDWKITHGICKYVAPVNLSFRKAILDRVVREEVLQWIIDSKNPAYDALYDPVKLKELHGHITTKIYHPQEQDYCDLPFRKLSIRNLAKVRLVALRAARQRIDR